MRHLALVFCLCTSPAFAEAPKVATDIAPVHSLVSMVMQGVGEPSLIVPPGTSPHHHAMRPSEARALAQSDLVVWIGHGLTPWLEGPIETLGKDARVIELMDVAGVEVLEMREGNIFDTHDHGHKDHEEHGDEHADEHGDDHGDDHADEHADEHGDAHGDEHAADPHLWLDPENAKVWLDVLANELATLDEANAATYRVNAANGQAQIDAAAAKIKATLAPHVGQKFIVLHDGFHYFEAHFGMEAFAAVSASDADTPGPARVSALRTELSEAGVTCAFSEPQIDPSLLETVTEGMDIKAGIIDPLGVDISLGSDHYPALLTSIADNLAACFDK